MHSCRVAERLPVLRLLQETCWLLPAHRLADCRANLPACCAVCQKPDYSSHTHLSVTEIYSLDVSL